MQLTDCLPRFREYLSVLKGYSPGTVKSYSNILGQFWQWFCSRGVEGGTPSILDIRQTDIEAWLKDLYFHHGNMANTTRASKLSAIKTFFKFLTYDGAMSERENPAFNIPTPKIARRLPQKFSTSQLQAIFAAPDINKARGIRDRAILTLLYGAGPRVSEIMNLDVADLHMSGREIYLHFRRTKGSKERIVRLSSRPADDLMRWLMIRDEYARPSEPSLFVALQPPSCAGLRLGTVSYNAVLKRYAAAVGIRKDVRVFVHKMRATFATDLYDAGIGLVEISGILGHESTETTRKYIAISERRLQQTAISNKRWKELELKEEG